MAALPSSLSLSLPISTRPSFLFLTLSFYPFPYAHPFTLIPSSCRLPTRKWISPLRQRRRRQAAGVAGGPINTSRTTFIVVQVRLTPRCSGTSSGRCRSGPCIPFCEQFPFFTSLFTTHTRHGIPTYIFSTAVIRRTLYKTKIELRE